MGAASQYRLPSKAMPTRLDSRSGTRESALPRKTRSASSSVSSEPCRETSTGGWASACISSSRSSQRWADQSGSSASRAPERHLRSASRMPCRRSFPLSRAPQGAERPSRPDRCGPHLHLSRTAMSRLAKLVLASLLIAAPARSEEPPARDAPSHGRPYFLPPAERERIRGLIAHEAWAKGNYAWLQGSAAQGNGFHAAFLYALDGDAKYLPAAR